MKVYIEKNNIQVELIRFSKNSDFIDFKNFEVGLYFLELGLRGENENALKLWNSAKRIWTQTILIESPAFYHWGLGDCNHITYRFVFCAFNGSGHVDA